MHVQLVFSFRTFDSLVTKEYIQKNITERGSCADFSIHDNGKGNPHVHIMWTMDRVDENGIGLRLDEEKASQYYKQEQRLKEWRKSWAGKPVRAQFSS